MTTDHNPLVAVVIPSYRVREQIMSVLDAIGPEVDLIYVVDDACPQQTATAVERECRDRRVRVLRHTTNQGVGGATITGYQAAITDGATIIVKVDGDGQMPVARIPALIAPLLRGEADYVKGNRFYDLSALREMPKLRLVGNAVLSFFNKLSSGYWDLFDPTNGFTAIHATVAACLPLDQVSRRYFFESDLLFHLNIVRAVVREIPIEAHYGDEQSSLRVRHVVGEFARKHIVNTFRRIFYNYFLRGFSIASIELLLGIAMTATGTTIGLIHWNESLSTGRVATSGTVMLAALPIVLGVQFLTAFFSHDIADVPRTPVYGNILRSRTGR